MNLKTDVGIIDVQKMIAQVNIELGVDISQKLEDVIRFHNSLTTGREERLKKEEQRLKIHKNIILLEHQTLAAELDKNLKYLNKHGALDDCVSINQKLNDDVASLDKLRSSVELIDKYKKREAEIKLKLAND